MPAKNKTWELVPPSAEPGDAMEPDTEKNDSQCDMFQQTNKDSPRFAEHQMRSKNHNNSSIIAPQLDRNNDSVTKKKPIHYQNFVRPRIMERSYFRNLLVTAQVRNTLKP